MPRLTDSSDDEKGSVPDEIPAKRKTTKSKQEDEGMRLDEDEKDVKAVEAKEAQEDDEDEDEEGEDEYQVETILSHRVKKGTVQYEIKWLGFDDPKDRTWEPLGNLDGAKEVLQAYHNQIGYLPSAESTSAKKKPVKRTASDAFDTPTAKKPRGRKSEAELAKKRDWQPPAGSWEDELTRVAAIVDDSKGGTGGGTKDPQLLYGLVEWNDGKKTQHLLKLLRKKCPQRLLDYYEQHLLKPKL